MSKKTPAFPASIKYYIADSRHAGSFLSPKSVDLIMTGPPYWNEVEYSRDDSQLSAIPDYPAFLEKINKVWQECAQILKGGGFLIMWLHDLYRQDKDGSFNYIPLHADIVKNMPPELIYRNLLVWDRYLRKDRGDMKSGGARFQFILIFQKTGGSSNNYREILRQFYWDPVWSLKTHPKILNSRLIFRFLFGLSKILPKQLINPLKPLMDKTGLIKDEHIFSHYSTECPPEVAERFIGLFSRKGDTVLDPFAGSGTTLYAASRLGRNAIGFDINEAAPLAMLRKYPQIKKDICDIINDTKCQRHK
ncbi:MAG: DNA modification methylase [Parcubacteria group bacterium Licking1014_17]|nr:MAG: DNA modification methylase [Parcubacteria group bacterium Licking1014_17]